MKSVLVISAHPDDHMTCAGFLMKLRRSGYSLYEIVLTGGNEGYVNEKEKIIEIRKREFEKASKLLGMKEVYYLGYKEEELIMNRENVEKVVTVIRKIRPNIIIIPNSDDYHENHIETNKIATKAIRTAMKKRKLELGEPIEWPIVLEWEYSVPKEPDIIIDISSEWKFKKKLLKCYKSQITRSEYQKLKALNEYRGAAIGVKYAEAFKVNRFIPFRLDKLLFC